MQYFILETIADAIIFAQIKNLPLVKVKIIFIINLSSFSWEYQTVQLESYRKVKSKLKSLMLENCNITKVSKSKDFHRNSSVYKIIENNFDIIENFYSKYLDTYEKILEKKEYGESISYFLLMLALARKTKVVATFYI